MMIRCSNRPNFISTPKIYSQKVGKNRVLLISTRVSKILIHCARIFVFWAPSIAYIFAYAKSSFHVTREIITHQSTSTDSEAENAKDFFSTVAGEQTCPE